MSFIFDIIIVAVILFCIWRGYKKGFIASFMRLVSLLGTIIATFIFYNPVSQFVYEKFMYGGVYNYINTQYTKNIASAEKSLDKLFTEMPDFFQSFLNRFTLSLGTSDIVEKHTTGSIVSSEDLVSSLATPIAETLSKIVAFIAVFVIVYIVLRILTSLLNKVVKLPLLNGLNRTLGVIFGIIIGLVFAWVLAIVFCFLLPNLMILFPNLFGNSSLETTIVTQALYKFNPLTLLELFRF